MVPQNEDEYDIDVLKIENRDVYLYYYMVFLKNYSSSLGIKCLFRKDCTRNLKHTCFICKYYVYNK